MTIRSVSLIGLGALGILFGEPLARAAAASADSDDPFTFRVVADPARIARYRREGIYRNGNPCSFDFVTPDNCASGSSDLVLIAVKDRGLEDAIQAVRNQVGPDTTILSLLNGISSETRIGAVFGEEKVLPCTAQGMDAVRTGNRLVFSRMGDLAFGAHSHSGTSKDDSAERVRAVAAFFDRAGVPYRVVADMRRHLWGKFMLNVGINQVLAVTGGGYGSVQCPGEPRELMLSAMREVVPLAACEGVSLGENDIARWMAVVATLSPEGKPSMSQDLEAGRPTELGLFAGTVLEMARRYGIDVPFNRMLFDRIRALESLGNAPPHGSEGRDAR